MSGGLIALRLVAVYVIHTYFFWRSGRTSGRTSSDEEKEGDPGAGWNPGSMKGLGSLDTDHLRLY